MRVVQKTENSDLATVYIGENVEGQRFEFVESTQPPYTRDQKWVLIISTMFGCPVGCSFCDAGVYYDGKLSYDDLLFQIDYLIRSRFPDKSVASEKFKIQFSRMGEPSFNKNVLGILRDLPTLYDIPGFIPSLSTVAPVGTNDFFEELLMVKKDLYPGSFQFQFSLHSTDETQRRNLIPVKKWDFDKMAEYGRRFFDPGGKKITLNFAISTSSIIQPDLLRKHFDPDIFLIKLTPVNPTYSARKNGMESHIINLESKRLNFPLQDNFEQLGYEVILSVGELEENLIGSNCGQYIQTMLREGRKQEDSYCYSLVEVRT
jgi:23S rRNA (adenine2503-C2)-methyltransferase